jgi:hypothetical protein
LIVSLVHEDIYIYLCINIHIYIHIYISRYNCFAGRDATRAMAKLSFEEIDLSNSNIDDLGPFELSTLEDWFSKFKDYKCYPIIGRVSKPNTFKVYLYIY